MTRHHYSLTLTRDEQDAIAFVASRGYAMAVWAALCNSAAEHERAYRNLAAGEPTTFLVSEPNAWAICEELESNGGHHFGPLSAALTAKLYAFTDEVV